MWRTIRLGLGAFLVAVLLAATAGTANAAVWWSSDRWGTWSSGGYTLYNNIWGSGAGAQCVFRHDADHIGLMAQTPHTDSHIGFGACDVKLQLRQFLEKAAAQRVEPDQQFSEADKGRVRGGGGRRGHGAANLLWHEWRDRQL